MIVFVAVVELIFFAIGGEENEQALRRLDVELLSVLADAGLCPLVANHGIRYHGPALTQAFSYVTIPAVSAAL